MSETDLYAVLGVARDADAEQIKVAWRAAARRLHPDRNPAPDAEAAFQQVSAAWTVLSDPDARLVYDRFGQSGLRQGMVEELARSIRSERATGRPASAPRPTSAGPRRSTYGGDDPRRPTDVRAAPRRAAAPTPARDVRVEVTVTLEEAARGGVRTVPIDDVAPCEDCAGTGIRASGRFCTTCDRTGATPRVRSVDVALPVSVASGQRLRIAGAGRTGTDGRRGALIVDVVVRPHAMWRRVGANLQVEVGWQPGTDKLVAPTLAGDWVVEVPAKARHGQVLRVPGKGMPGAGGRPAGDLLVTLRPPK